MALAPPASPNIWSWGLHRRGAGSTWLCSWGLDLALLLPISIAGSWEYLAPPLVLFAPAQIEMVTRQRDLSLLRGNGLHVSVCVAVCRGQWPQLYKEYNVW